MLNNLSTDNLYIVPQNERIGAKLVADGQLDAEFFEKIRPFYNQPIDVPQGELKILLELFPQLSFDIALSKDFLKKYHPWDQSAIARFFQDHPAIAQFEPILRFDIKPVDFRAKAAFVIRKSSTSELFSSGANMSIGFSELFKMDTRITFNNDYARWYRRAFYYVPTDNFSLQIGNFGTFFDKGLFYGYFRSTDAFKDLRMNNWLYGSARTWNGVKIQIAGDKKEILRLFSTTAYLHKRETETSGGAVLNIKVSDKMNVNSGFSLLNLYGYSENSFYAHCGIKLKFNSLNIEMQSGADIDNPGSIPFLVESRYKLNSNRFNFTFVFLPKNFNAPCSYMLHKIQSNKDEITEAVSMLSVQSVHYLKKWISLIPVINVEFTGQKTEKVCFRVSALNSLSRFKQKLTYSIIPGCGLTDTTSNSLCNTLRIYLGKKIVVGNDIDFLYQDRYNYSINSLLIARVDLFPALALQPSVYFLHTKEGRCSFVYSFEQILKLHDKTYSQLKIEQSIDSRKKGESLNVEAKASFIF
ncbi:MAG: hypothetical protein GX267_16670 [Fibrobacter sp.]|nr:hypothetical protein [Fibrobacter sp.]